MDEVEAVAQAISEARTGNTLSYRHFVPEAQAAIAALDAARGDSHNDVLSSCQPYLKQGETPAECIKRNRDDGIALMELLAAERIKVSNYEKTMAAISEIENGEARRRRLETASEAQLIDYINELEGKLCAAIDAARGKAEPVAWMYHHPSHPKRRPPASVDFIRVEGPLGDGWIETPLYAHPPADRVAQVVEFIREQQANAHRHMLEASHRKTASHFAAAFVTLRNLVDAIERGEPFNG